LNRERIEAFLYNTPHYRERLSTYPRQPNAALLGRLDALIDQFAPLRAASEGA
jgi:hypothetical protein